MLRLPAGEVEGVNRMLRIRMQLREESIHEPSVDVIAASLSISREAVLKLIEIA